MFDDFFEEPLPTLDRQAAFKLLDSVIAKRSTLPCIMAVKVTGDAGYLTFEGTDLDIGAKVRAPNFLDFRGVAVVDWKAFKAQANLVPVDKMDAFDPTDFPTLPDVEGQDIGTQWLADGRKCLYAVSKNKTRLSLNGVYIHEDGCVATDGHRLHLVPGSYGCQAIVPPKVFTATKGVPDKCLVTEAKIALVYPWGHVVSKVLEGQYPNYQQIVPREAHKYPTCTVDTKTLLDACVRACALRKEVPSVLFSGGTLSIQGIAGDWIAIAPVKAPEGFEVRFNAKYMQDTLKGLGPVTTIHCAHPLKAVLFNVKDSEETRILMPIRLYA